MKRLLLMATLALLSASCVHRWVGRPVTQLEKEYGRPLSIRPLGDNKLYVYPDVLAGRGQMTFTVDRRGIIKSWDATPNVPGPWPDDVFDDFPGGVVNGGGVFGPTR